MLNTGIVFICNAESIITKVNLVWRVPRSMAVGVFLVETVVPVHLSWLSKFSMMALNVNSFAVVLPCKFIIICIWKLFCICICVYIFICLLNTWQQILLQSYQRASSRPGGRSSCLRGTVCCAPWLLLLFWSLIFIVIVLSFCFTRWAWCYSSK